MSDSTALAGLLDQAGKVFSLAGKLGRAFDEERQRHQGLIDPAAWNRHAPMFKEFSDALSGLQEPMHNPPARFAPVAAWLRKAAGIAKRVQEAMQRPDSRTRAAYWEFAPDLNLVSKNGSEAIAAIEKDADESQHRVEDLFASVEPFEPMSKRDLERFAADIHAVINRYKALERFREMVRQCFKEHQPSAGLLPLPRRALTMPEKYAVLAAIYDVCGMNERIDPWPKVSLERKAGYEPMIDAMPYFALRSNVLPKETIINGHRVSTSRGIPISSEPYLRIILAEVEADQSDTAAPSLTLLDRFPATSEGHVAFIEWVYFEVRDQAVALRQGKTSHESISKQLKQGVRWEEAGLRIALVSGLSAKPIEQVTQVLRKVPTIGNVEQIADLLGPAVGALRNALEQSRETETDPDTALEEVAILIPELDAMSEDWITNRAAAKLLGVDTETLANRRSIGVKHNSNGERYGQHDGYCFWRKSGNKHPMYYLPRMREHAGQLVKLFPKATLNRH